MTASQTASQTNTDPVDEQEQPATLAHLDLGALRMSVSPAVRLNVAAQADGTIEDLVVHAGNHQMRLDVFAAPRRGGLWAGTAATLVESLTLSGAHVEQEHGEWGAQVQAVLPTADAHVPLLIIGFDGPVGSGWMLRATVQPVPAAADTPEDAEAPADVEDIEEIEAGEAIEDGDVREPDALRAAGPVTLPEELAQILRSVEGVRDELPRPPGSPMELRAAPELLVPHAGDGRSLADYSQLETATDHHAAQAGQAYRTLPGLLL